MSIDIRYLLKLMERLIDSDSVWNKLIAITIILMTPILTAVVLLFVLSIIGVGVVISVGMLCTVFVFAIFEFIYINIIKQYNIIKNLDKQTGK